MDIRTQLRKARTNAGLTQKELAEKAGIAAVTIQQYERGVREPRIGQLGKIAKALNITVSEMIGPNWNGIDMSDAFEQDNKSYKESLDQQLSGIDFALSGEIHDLTDNEKQDILDYIRFKKSQRGGGDQVQLSGVDLPVGEG